MAAPVNVLLGLQGHRDRGGVFRHTGEGYCEYRVYCMCGMRSRTIAPYTHIRIYAYTHIHIHTWRSNSNSNSNSHFNN